MAASASMQPSALVCSDVLHTPTRVPVTVRMCARRKGQPFSSSHTRSGKNDIVSMVYGQVCTLCLVWVCLCVRV